MDLLMASTASILMLLTQSVSSDAGAATMELMKDGTIVTHSASRFAQAVRRKARQTLWPPKPKELDNAKFSF